MKRTKRRYIAVLLVALLLQNSLLSMVPIQAQEKKTDKMEERKENTSMVTEAIPTVQKQQEEMGMDSISGIAAGGIEEKEDISILVYGAQGMSEDYGAVQVCEFGEVKLLRYENANQAVAALASLQEAKKQGIIVTAEVNRTVQVTEEMQEEEVQIQEEEVQMQEEEAQEEKNVPKENNVQTEENVRGEEQETDNWMHVAAGSQMTVESRDIIVAVIDTGYDKQYGCMERIVDSKYNSSGTGNPENIADDMGHGTQMASIILANTSESVKVMPIKALNAQGVGDLLSVYQALSYALKAKVDIINLSVDSYQILTSSLLSSMLEKAQQQGILVVTSAGNQGVDISGFLQEKQDNTLVVSALNQNMEKSSYSNYGNGIDFCSYGTMQAYGLQLQLDSVTGTSVAAAMVTAAAAECMVMDNQADYQQVITNLSEQSYIPKGIEQTAVYGRGLITKEGVNALYERKVCEQAEIFHCDYEHISDEAFNKIIQNTTEVNLRLFLKGLSEKQLEELIKRDTDLNKTAQRITFDKDFHMLENRSFVYYKYLLEENINVQSVTVFGSTTGYFYAKYKQDGKESSTTKITVQVTNVNPNTVFTSVPVYTLTSSNTKVFYIADEQTETEPDSSGNYYVLNTMLCRDKVPAHYTATSWIDDHVQSDNSDVVGLKRVTTGHQEEDYTCQFLLNVDTNGTGLTWWGPQQANGLDLEHKYENFARHTTITVEFSSWKEKLYVDPNGGKYSYTKDGETITEKEKFLLAAKKCGKTSNIAVPKKSGYVFQGWKVSHESGGNGKYDKESKKFTFCGKKKEATTTLKALWATVTPKPTNTATPKPTNTATPKPTNTATPKPTNTATPKPTNTATPKPTNTAIPVSTNVPMPSISFIPKNTTTPKPTNTATPASTNTPTPEPTNTPMPEPTNTPTPEPTNTPTPRPTNTPTPRPTNTPTPKPTNTPTPTPVHYVVQYMENTQKASTKRFLDWNRLTQSQKIIYGTKTQLSEVPGNVLPGYTFQGWNTKADGSGTSFQNGEIISVAEFLQKAGIKAQNVDEVIPLYAQWSPNTYTLFFHENTPTAENNTHKATAEARVHGTTKIAYVWDSSIYWGQIEELSLPTAELTGWHPRFSDSLWYTSSDYRAPGLPLKDGTQLGYDTLGMPGDKHIYAQWEANTYQIMYHGNGEMEGNRGVVIGQMEIQEMVYDLPAALSVNKYGKQDQNYLYHDDEMLQFNSYNVKHNPQAATDFQYIFLGWSREPISWMKMSNTDTWIPKQQAEQEKIWNLTTKDKDMVSLYACWDGMPNITTKSEQTHFDRYEGAYLTMADMKKMMKAYDLEEGEKKEIVIVNVSYYKGDTLLESVDAPKDTSLLDTTLPQEMQKEGGYKTYQITYQVVDEWGISAYYGDKTGKQVSYVGKIYYNQPPQILSYDNRKELWERFLYLSDIQDLSETELEKELLRGVQAVDKEDKAFQEDKNNDLYLGRVLEEPIFKIVDRERFAEDIRQWSQEKEELEKSWNTNIVYCDIFNKQQKTVQGIHIIDGIRSIWQEQQKERSQVRFISQEYLDTLKENSVWNSQEEYRRVLENVLQKNTEIEEIYEWNGQQ